MSIHFQYRADFHEMEEGTDMGDESVECDEPCYDISNDTGKYGSLGEAALDALRNKYPQRVPGTKYRVMISGRIVFSQDYYGECDADVEVEWSHVCEYDEEVYSPDDETVQLLSDDTDDIPF